MVNKEGLFLISFMILFRPVVGAQTGDKTKVFSVQAEYSATLINSLQTLLAQIESPGNFL